MVFVIFLSSQKWLLVRSQIICDAVFDQLESIEDIGKMSSSQSSKSVVATKAIAKFKQQAKGATPDNLIQLQKSLADALGDITHTAECYERKLATYEMVYRYCKLGKASFINLYEEAILDFKPNTGDCRSSSGLPYTTKDDVNMYLKKRADKEKFEYNCLLNSGLKKALTCKETLAGYTLEQISVKLNITISNAESLTKSCPPSVPDKNESEEICSMSKFIRLEKIYKIFPEFSKNEVNKIFVKC